jgi:hypothetical protein
VRAALPSGGVLGIAARWAKPNGTPFLELAQGYEEGGAFRVVGHNAWAVVARFREW